MLPWMFVNLGPQEIEPPARSGALAFLGIRMTTGALGWWRVARQMLRGWAVLSVDGCYSRWSPARSEIATIAPLSNVWSFVGRCKNCRFDEPYDQHQDSAGRGGGKAVGHYLV